MRPANSCGVPILDMSCLLPPPNNRNAVRACEPATAAELDSHVDIRQQHPPALPDVLLVHHARLEGQLELKHHSTQLACLRSGSDRG